MNILRGRSETTAAGVEVTFRQDDVTNLKQVNGMFDLVTDFGALNDMNQEARDLYMENVLPLTHLGSKYLMFCFEKMLPSDEIKRRFGKHFAIEELDSRPGSGFPDDLAFYLMERTMQNLK